MIESSYPGPATIHRTVLSNGIVVLVYKNMTVDMVVIDGIIRAGALGESKAKAGLASFTADMLMHGSEDWQYSSIFESLESVGAALVIGSNRHVSDFSGRCLVEDLPLLLEILASSIRQPVFPIRQFENVRSEILTSLQLRSNDTGRMASLAFRELLYKDHPYGQSVDGYEESIQQLDQSDLIEFHRRFYGPVGMIISVVGAIEPQAAVEQIQNVLGDWQKHQELLPKVPPASRPMTIQRVQVSMPEKPQSNIVMGLPGPLRSAVDYLEASMANTILGVFGMMGRLGKKVREELGLAYSIYTSLHGGLGPSPWTIGTGVAPENVDRAIDSILMELERIRKEPIPIDELADSQAYRTGILPMSLETNSGIASVLTDIELYQLGLDYLQNLPDKLMAMTPESVQAAAHKYLSTEQLSIAVAGPTSIEEDC